MSENLPKEVTLAQAVAASSSFPVAIQPLIITFKDDNNNEIKVPLTDGGVYDNLGTFSMLFE